MNEDAQIVISMSSVGDVDVDVRLGPVAMTRAESLALAQWVIALREKEKEAT